MQSGVAKRGLSASMLVSVLCLLVLAGCNLGYAAYAPSPSFDGPPEIHIAAPQPEQKYQSGATVIVQARVENAGPDLSRVALLLNEILMAEQLNPNVTNAEILPLTMDWPTSDEGEFTIAVIAERGDGSSAREDISIMVVSPNPYQAPETTSLAPPGEVDAPSQTEEATAPARALQDSSQATATGPGASPLQVPGTVIRPASLRPGSGVDTGPPVGSLMVDDDILIIAVNPAGSWLRIQRDAEIDGWVDASSVAAAGDLSELPIEAGQPPAPGEGVNLVVASIELLPDPPLCGQPTIVRAILRNSGAVDSQTSPWVTAKAHLLSDESVQAENPETVYLPVLDAGEETVLDIPLTLSARADEPHVIRVTVDHGNHVIETHENDNTGSSRQFELSRGSCGA